MKLSSVNTEICPKSAGENEDITFGICLFYNEELTYSELSNYGTQTYTASHNHIYLHNTLSVSVSATVCPNSTLLA